MRGPCRSGHRRDHQGRLSPRTFLCIPLYDSTPDHSSLTTWRQRLPVGKSISRPRILTSAHQQGGGVLYPHVAAVAPTTIEANAARNAWSEKILPLSPSTAPKDSCSTQVKNRVDTAVVVHFDRKGKKLSNRYRQPTTHPAFSFTEMEDGTTNLTDKFEHAVNLASGTLLTPEIHTGDYGDTSNMEEILTAANDNLASQGDETWISLCAVTSKGYRKAELIKRLNRDHGIMTYRLERDPAWRRRRHGDTKVAAKYTQIAASPAETMENA